MSILKSIGVAIGVLFTITCVLLSFILGLERLIGPSKIVDCVSTDHAAVIGCASAALRAGYRARVQATDGSCPRGYLIMRADLWADDYCEGP